MKSRLGALLAGLVLNVVPLSCGTDSRLDSGTSTNWYSRCDENAECGSELACICGRCTRLCDDETDCGEGACASRLASVVQCDGAEEGLICVQPDPETCSRLTLGEDETLEATAASDCTAGAILCESFDAPFPASYSTWVSPLSEQAVGALQDCDVFSGDGALQVATPADEWWQTRVELPEALESGEVHARFYAKISSTYPIPSYLILFELWNALEATDDKISVELTAGEGIRLVVGPNGTQHGSQPATTPLDQWFCVELALDLAAAGTAQLSVDGVPAIAETGLVTLPAAAPFSIATFGAVASPDDVAGFDVLLDDLVVGREKIGCL